VVSIKGEKRLGVDAQFLIQAGGDAVSGEIEITVKGWIEKRWTVRLALVVDDEHPFVVESIGDA